jgi:hypothetical protein
MSAPNLSIALQETVNWDNKALDQLTEQLAALFREGMPTQTDEHVQRMAQCYTRYAYLLGKIDGHTEGILTMSKVTL